jgi:hypothetical protein
VEREPIDEREAAALVNQPGRPGEPAAPAPAESDDNDWFRPEAAPPR